MKLLRFLFSRIVIVGLMLTIQLIIFIMLITKFSHISVRASFICTIISALVVLWIINKSDNPAYKLAWIIPILIFNISGGILYIILGNKKPSIKMRRELEKVQEKTSELLKQDNKVRDEIEKENPIILGHANYINNAAGFPIYKNTEVKYYSLGEYNYEDLINELKKAKKYIFMEYFIIEEGKMWNGILEILEQKAKEGLDVRLMYDDMGCISLLPLGYDKKLEKKGIKCIAFNPFKPLLSLAMNNRDHRKITVIDGHTGFTGGINLADEYINEKERFGHWKDTGVMLKGDAVWNLTIMFLEMWNSVRKTDEDYFIYNPEVYQVETIVNDGYVQPYGDSPLDEEIVGENVYMNIINTAKKYVYIFTPYLIIDNEMMTALCLAAKRGVDVKIVTPGIPDKKTVFKLTRSYYPQLIRDGVKIYEYTPGFIHAKVFLCDDEIATVGTINMDYRSLYLHFECGVYLYKNKCISNIKEDMLDTIEKSHEFSKEDIKEGRRYALWQAILRVFAPLM
ncbi:MAG: cardiolipin synthase [Terrisporobacter sp.]|uniref:cardiolipin synthase n=1 Tax=Terrisporobacter sp. TaxID=1965305 RepID=UPI002FCC61CA